jgi:hypothetical protein
MPSLRITASGAAFSGRARAITRRRPSGPKAARNAASPPSVARPLPHTSLSSM